MMDSHASNARAMNFSLATGVLMLVAKWIAFGLTGSSVIFSDAAESVVHIVAVWFAWYALRLGNKPPDADHPYGHDKVSFLSAGVEGGLICIAAIVIIVSAVEKLVVGVDIQKLELGISITAGAAAVNLALGLYLMLISVKGLMDTADPLLLGSTQKIIDEYCQANNCSSHRLRLRTSGNLVHVDYHLLVPDDMRMQDAHNLATQLEERVRQELGLDAEVFTHLESYSQPEGHV